MKGQISIIGCGWFGFPLARTLIDNGYKVKGSTTSVDKLKILKEANIDGFLIRLQPEGISGNYKDFLSGSDTIVVNIPPGLRKNPDKDHVLEIQYLIKVIEEQGISNVIYISSTSVFKDEGHFPLIQHNSKPNGTSNSAQQLIAIERILQDHMAFNTTIIRFGGLIDAERHPAKYLSGRQNIQNPDAPINLIHKDDCIAIISKVIENNLWNLALNAASPQHPTKNNYYTAYCKQYNLPAPQFSFETKSKGKIIDSSKLEQLLNYSFQHSL